MKITDEQRERFVEVYLEALDAAGMPDDKPFRQAVRMSSSACASRSRTPGPKPRLSYTRFERYHAGSGRSWGHDAVGHLDELG